MSNDIPTESDLLSARALAAALDVTSATVRRWVRAGTLVPTQITYGGYYRFNLEDAKKQLESQRFVRNRHLGLSPQQQQALLGLGLNPAQAKAVRTNLIPHDMPSQDEYIQAALDTDE